MPKPENIEPHKFKPGQTGNPNGRPKKLPSIDKLLAEVLGDENDENSEAKAILEAIAAKAKKGDTRAAEILLDRAYGKARQQVDMKHSGAVDTRPKRDLSKLSIEELETLERLVRKSTDSGDTDSQSQEVV